MSQSVKHLASLACVMVTSWLLPALAFAAPDHALKVTIDKNDRMTIILDVAGKDVPAVIDTAATFPMIDRGILNAGNSVPLDAEVEILGMDGKQLFPTAEVGPVQAGANILGNIQAAVNTKSRFIGHRTVLPLNAFGYQSIDFDFQNSRIDFYNRRPIQPERNIATRMKYEDLIGLIFIPVKLNGKRGKALIDTGSDVTYVNTAFAKLSKARPEPEKTRQLFGTASHGVPVKVFSANRFQLGSHVMRRFDILVADPPVFDHLQLTDQPTMVIGLDFLRQFRVQIDRKHQVILFGREQEPGSLGRHTINHYHRGRAPRY